MREQRTRLEIGYLLRAPARSRFLVAALLGMTSVIPSAATDLRLTPSTLRFFFTYSCYQKKVPPGLCRGAGAATPFSRRRWPAQSAPDQSQYGKRAQDCARGKMTHELALARSFRTGGG